jgi:hypothetical protein
VLAGRTGSVTKPRARVGLVPQLGFCGTAGARAVPSRVRARRCGATMGPHVTRKRSAARSRQGTEDNHATTVKPLLRPLALRPVIHALHSRPLPTAPAIRRRLTAGLIWAYARQDLDAPEMGKALHARQGFGALWVFYVFERRMETTVVGSNTPARLRLRGVCSCAGGRTRPPVMPPVRPAVYG